MNTLSGGGLEWMLEAGFNVDELLPYRYPSAEEFDAAELQIVYLGWFLGDWSLVNNAAYSCAYGLEKRDDTVENTGDLYGVTSLDEDWVTLNQMIKYYKFGFGRVTDYVNEEIRLGRISRDRAIELVEAYDDACAPSYIESFCEYIGTTPDSFWRHVRASVNRELFEVAGDGSIPDVSGRCGPMSRLPSASSTMAWAITPRCATRSTIWGGGAARAMSRPCSTRATCWCCPESAPFVPAIDAIRARHLDRYLIEQASLNRPLLGICLGMQLLAQASHEDGFTHGLGLVPGEVVGFPAALAHRLEHHRAGADRSAVQRKRRPGVLLQPFLCLSGPDRVPSLPLGGGRGVRLGDPPRPDRRCSISSREEPGGGPRSAAHAHRRTLRCLRNGSSE